MRVSRGGSTVACGRVLDATVRSCLDTVSNGERLNALTRQKVHRLCLKVSKKPDAAKQAFERPPKQCLSMKELNKMGRRSRTPQIVQRMGDKGLTPHHLPAEFVSTYVIRESNATMMIILRR